MKDAIMLDDHLFKLDIDNGTVRLSTSNGRITLKVYASKYHEKFKSWRIGQAWLVKKEEGRLAATKVVRVTEVAASQNGSILKRIIMPHRSPPISSPRS